MPPIIPPPAFQSTLPVRGATHLRAGAAHVRAISIHAPREGSDLLTIHDMVFLHISIHAPREGSDSADCTPPAAPAHFNPRSPGGERPPRQTVLHPVQISIHAPRRGATGAELLYPADQHISIHAPREGSDSPALYAHRDRRISIHAPREGSDPRE